LEIDFGIPKSISKIWKLILEFQNQFPKFGN
jgi:hypothetical protein